MANYQFRTAQVLNIYKLLNIQQCYYKIKVTVILIYRDQSMKGNLLTLSIIKVIIVKGHYFTVVTFSYFQFDQIFEARGREDFIILKMCKFSK